MRERLKRHVWTPILVQVKQGLSPHGLAWSVALGLALGLFPVLGATTLLCFLAALVLRLNQPVMQAVNYLAYPLQLLLLIPFIRLGERIFGAPRLPLSLFMILQAMKADLRGAMKFLRTSLWHASVAWTLVALPSAFLLAFLLTLIFRRLAPRWKEAP